MPWVVREAVRDINRAVGRRWHAIDPLLPDPATMPAGCGEPLVVTGDNGRPAGLLLAQWRDHLAGIGATRGPDTSASVVWPSLDITGVPALLRHGLQPLTVIAARTRPAAAGLSNAAPRGAHGVAIRAAGPADEEQVLDLELRLIRYDMQFGGPVWRASTARLVRDEIRASLDRPLSRTWLAERNGRAVGLLVAQSPQEGGWIGGVT